MNTFANIIETIGQILLRIASAIRAGSDEYRRQTGKIQRSKIILP